MYAYISVGDTITTPTASMLLAIQNTTLFDDGYGEDTTTSFLEASMATLCNHEAGVFVLSGTMGNQLAIRFHLNQPPYSVLCDHRAHILYLEAGGVAMLSGAIITGVVPANGNYLTLEDIETHAVISDNCHSCPIKVISLETHLGESSRPSLKSGESLNSQENGVLRCILTEKDSGKRLQLVEAHCLNTAPASTA
jgi:threonine aldolase